MFAKTATNSLFQLVNNGPSVVSQSALEVRCPLRAHGYQLLYPLELVTEGPLRCSSKHTFNALKLKVKTHQNEQSSLSCGGQYHLFLNINVFLCAAPASSSRWSHFTEIQWWASHPEERAVQRPRWTRKPGELTWKEQKLYRDWIKDLWEDLPVFRYSRGRCKHTYTRCASDEHSFSIALLWSCQTVRKKIKTDASRVGLPLFSSFKLTCMLLNYLFTSNNYLETVKTVLLK